VPYDRELCGRVAVTPRVPDLRLALRHVLIVTPGQEFPQPDFYLTLILFWDVRAGYSASRGRSSISRVGS
jgi:hypothetical protein